MTTFLQIVVGLVALVLASTSIYMISLGLGHLAFWLRVKLKKTNSFDSPSALEGGVYLFAILVIGLAIIMAANALGQFLLNLLSRFTN